MISVPSRPTAPPQPALVELEGRQVELETLRAALLQARRSPMQLIWISGEAGVGKTALAAQLQQPAVQAGGQFVMGKCEQFRGDASLQAPRQALAQLLAHLSTRPKESHLPLAEGLRKSLGPDGGALLALLPELAAITGPLPQPSALELHEQPQRLLSLLRSLLAGLVRQVKPLVLVLDDLQWADPLSLSFISALLDDPNLHGLLLLGLFRDPEAASDLTRLLQQATTCPRPPIQLALTSLSLSHLNGLLARRLRCEAAAVAPLAKTILNCTGGNPFFVHQLISALQREGLLRRHVHGNWQWHQGELRQRLASGDVVAFLRDCLSQLPAASLAVLECMAQLGSQTSLELLAAASGEPLPNLPGHLLPALERGVLVCSQPERLASADPAVVVGFGHDRLEQAVANLNDPQGHAALLLAMGRRLNAAGQQQLAADCFAITTAPLSGPEEHRQVATLLQQVGSAALEQGNFGVAERLLQRALALLDAEATGRDPETLLDPETIFEVLRGLHQLAYCRVDHARVDALYGDLQQRAQSPEVLLEPTAIQVMALSNRSRYQSAVDLVADLLRRLAIPMPMEATQAALERELATFSAWVERGGLELLPPLPARPPAGGGVTKLLNRLVPAAFFCNPALANWLVLHSSLQWLGGDAHPARLYPLACTLLATVAANNDYATGYQAARTALKLGEASGHRVETARTRHVFSLFCQHWFEPLEQALVQARRAHADQERSGELEFACYTFYTTQAAVLEFGQALAELAEENGRALEFARRSDNRHAEPAFTAFTDLLETLGATPTAAGMELGSDPGDLSQLAQTNPMAACYHHVYRGVAAVVLADPPALLRHAEAASRLEAYITGFYPVALIHLLRGLALVEQLRHGQDPAISAALHNELTWLSARAADAPQNFAHLASLLEAERLAALDQRLEALEIYERSLRDAMAHQRSWHAALIGERAGRCYLAFGLEQAGQRLLEQAYQRYTNWGATRKSAALLQDCPFLRFSAQSSGEWSALLQASHALGRQPTVTGLAQATAALIAQLSSATDVQIVVLDSQGQWQVKGGLSPQETVEYQSLEQADRRGLLPISAVHLSLQRLQPLVFHDALLDRRVSGDLFFEPLTCCSLLVVPVLVQHRPIAVVVAAHRQQRGAFVADQARPVELLCGQLAVALENLLIQNSLEQQVQGIRSGGGTSTKTSVAAMGLPLFSVISFQPRCDPVGSEEAASALQGAVQALRVVSLAWSNAISAP